MKIVSCNEYHSEQIARRIEEAWAGEHLLLIAPPGVSDLPEWERLIRSHAPYSEPPVFGLFSTGTLGRKLILYSRRNLLASLDGIFSFFDVESIDSVFSYPQPFHVFGLVLGYLFPLLYQKQGIYPPGPYSRAAHELWLQSAEPGMLSLGTPTHFQDLIKFCDGQLPPPTYSAIIGGAPVTRALWLDVQEKLGIEYPSIGYGASELSPGATHLPPGWVPQEDNEIGLPLPNVDLSVHPGKGIRVRGENACLAIFQNGLLHLPREVWLRDEVKERDDGVLVFSNRTDLLLNRGGEKYSFEEIERLLWCELQLETVAVGVPHSRLGEELALLIKGSTVAADTTLRAQAYLALKNAFGREFDASLCFPIGEFPLGASSKVDRSACRSWVEARRAAH